MRLALALFGLAALAACQTPVPAIHQQERFDPASAFSRVFPASPEATCDAARRALLSQGYLTSAAKRDEVEGRKKFQHDHNTHVEIEFHVVCAPNNAGGGSVAFVNALQDRYALKKSATSASVGVGAFGTVSVPFGSSDDAMVKVASETISAGDFYARFFGLVAHYLVVDDETTTP
ncbi:MAG TPA: DUF2242 domain-containing protein [Burkholderiales bacterium]|jgi:hypothetical protein|nr:DUF2242 domain-containing protein [Burkholderiales bacterium]